MFDKASLLVFCFALVSCRIVFSGDAVEVTTGAAAKVEAGLAVEAKVFPLTGQLKGLEPEKLDFRYRPYRWQACIGFPDDPYKSIVGSDGGLYYGFGGGKFYGFKTRVLAGLKVKEGKGKKIRGQVLNSKNTKKKIRQLLLDPRIPVVITEQDWGKMTLHQEAWSGVFRKKSVNRFALDGATSLNLYRVSKWSRQSVREWSSQRVDYLWLKLKNNGSKALNGDIIVSVNTPGRLVLSKDRTRLLDDGNKKSTFCVMSPACGVVEQAPSSRVQCDHSPVINMNWGRPDRLCDVRFRHIMVGENRPLVFKYHCNPGEKYRAAFGFIESWHDRGGIRPLEIRIEGKVVRKIDLVKEYGRNTPVVLCFDAEDSNRDGVIELGVYSPKGARDTNTILNALWLFKPGNAPAAKEILAGGIDNRAEVFVDVNNVRRDNSKKLIFKEELLAPGEEKNVFLTFCLGEKAKKSIGKAALTSIKDALKERNRAVSCWKNVDLPYDRIRVPDKAVQGLLDSCIRNIYQAREIRDGQPAFQVGPTCYRGTWAADGPFIMEAVTYLGRAKEVRAGLEHQVDKDTGPGGVAFSKKAGLRLWMIRRHAQLTGDTAWLEKMWPRVIREVNRIKQYREMTRKDPLQANYGLMPIGFGDGGLGGKHREYTNVYWTLSGLRAAIKMALRLNKPVAASWQAEYRDYWKYFDKARERDKLVDQAGNIYVPVTMKGETKELPQRGAWAFLQSIFPGRIFKKDDPLMRGTMDMLDATVREGLIFGTGWLADGIWNYAGSFYAHAHLWLGHGKKAAATLYAFGNHACPLLCWREEQNLVGQPYKDCGDMPHNWASGEFIRLVRHLLVLERGRELHLLEGLPRAWTAPGDVTHLEKIPTSFGLVSLTLRMFADGNRAEILVIPPRREYFKQIPGRLLFKKIVIHLEQFGRAIKTVSAPIRVDPGREGGAFTVKIKFVP